MRLRARSRWVRLLAGMAVVLFTLPWSPGSGNPPVAAASNGPDQVYIAPFTGTIDFGNPEAGNAQAISDAIQFAVAQALAKKYPCASVATSQDLANILGLEKQKELLAPLRRRRRHRSWKAWQVRWAPARSSTARTR